MERGLGLACPSLHGKQCAHHGLAHIDEVLECSEWGRGASERHHAVCRSAKGVVPSRSFPGGSGHLQNPR